MATRNIAIQITLGGIEQTITSVNELETAIKQATTELKNFTGSPQERERLVNQLRNANSQLKEFNKEIKGLSVDQQISKFLQFGSLVTSTFATASTVISSLGLNSENAAEAQARAQQILTIAFTASEIARQKDTIQTIRNTVAQIASTVATQGLTAAMRLLFTTIKANPLGAFLTLITLVVGALVALTGATDDANNSEKQYQATLEKTRREREFQLSLLQSQGASEVELSRIRIENAQKDLREARTRLEVMKQMGGSEKAINQELNVIAESKKVIILENARIERITNEERAKNDKELADQLRRNLEERTRLLLEELKLQSELRKIELERTTSGLGIEIVPPTTDVEKQNEALKNLKKTQSEYNDIFDEYQSLLTQLGPSDVMTAFSIPEKVQNAIKINRELIANSFELAGLESETQSKLLNNLLLIQSNFDKGLSANTEEFIKNRQDLIKFEQTFIDNYVETQIKGFEGTEEVITAQRNNLAEQAKIVFDNIIKNGEELLKVTNFYTDTAKKIRELSDENRELAKSTEVLNGFLQKNSDLIVSTFNLPIDFRSPQEDLLAIEEEIKTKRFDLARTFATDIEQLEFTLLQNGIDIRGASYEEKLLLLQKFLQKEVEATEEAEKKKQIANQKTIDKLLEQIQAAQQALQAIQQAVSDYYNFTFDQLEKRNKRIQDTIVGDSERANQLRLEADKAYTAERERLEKQQAKISLRLTLAQTIANVAQAVAQSLGNPILATIVGLAGAAQVGIITQQINAIDSYKRGGKIRKGQGGMVVGNSHENGGVKFQGGGIELEGNEAVINRLSTLRYADILSTINQAGGGRPIITNNFDDSRIVEAIAKQRNTPIRAYVVESDISNAQTVNKRLELLSQI
jgi:hypothetical protein